MKLATDLPGLLNRIDHPSEVVRVASRMRLADFAEMLQRRVRHAQGPPQYRGAAGFVGLSVGRDD